MLKALRLSRSGFGRARVIFHRLGGRLGLTSTVDRPFQYGSGPDFHRRLSEVEETQWWSREQFRAAGERRRTAVVLRAYDNIPFYRERFSRSGLARRDLEQSQNFSALPTIGKSDLQEHGEAMLDPTVPKRHRRYATTGGTTGRPVGFWQHREQERWEEAFVWRHWRWFGIEFADRGAILRGMRPPGGTAPIGEDRRLGLVLSGFDLGLASAADYLAALGRYRPAFIRGYPSLLDLLARRALELGSERWPELKAVFTSSELLKPEQRERISRAFGAPVADLYGHAERAVAAGGCPAGGMHAFPEYGELEILDSGEIVGTAFHNPATPLIRYRTGDLARRLEHSCGCGRTMPLLAIESGRMQDYILTPEGNHLTASAINFHSRIFDGIELFRFLQSEPSSVRFEYVTAPGVERIDETEVAGTLHEKLGPTIRIEFARRPAIPRTPSGKHRFIVSSLANGARGC